MDVPSYILRFYGWFKFLHSICFVSEHWLGKTFRILQEWPSKCALHFPLFFSESLAACIAQRMINSWSVPGKVVHHFSTLGNPYQWYLMVSWRSERFVTETSLFLNPICRIRTESTKKCVWPCTFWRYLSNSERAGNGDNRRDTNPDLCHADAVHNQLSYQARIKPQFTCMNFICCHHIYKCLLSMALSSTSLTTSSHLAWQLNWWSTAPASQRSGFESPFRREFFRHFLLLLN